MLVSALRQFSNKQENKTRFELGNNHMKILGVGLNKTGTTSLQHACRILGFKTEGSSWGSERLADVLDGSNSDPDFRRYDDVDAVFDTPTAYFYAEILAAYPNCKCILTIRNEDNWWTSIEKHFNERTPVTSLAQDPHRWRWRTYVYGSSTAHEFLYRKKYREHNERVVRSIPSQQLLIMDIANGDGWAKLCPFLGVAIPVSPFPHQNVAALDTATARRQTTDEVNRVIPRTQKFILIDDGWLAGHLPQNTRTIPFLERNGQYWGKPEDDDEAIRELERLRRKGVCYIVFAEPAFWWLDHYAEFYKHLRANYQCVLNRDYVIAFALSSSPPGTDHAE